MKTGDVYTGQCIQSESETTINVNDNDMKFKVTKQGSAILGKEACVKLGLITRVDEINTDVFFVFLFFLFCDEFIYPAHNG